MELALTDITYRQPLSLTHRRRRRRSSIAFSKSASFSSIRASTRNETPKSQIRKFVTTGFTVAVIIISRFTAKPAVAATIDLKSDIQEEQKTLEEHHNNAVKTVNGKLEEAIGMPNQLVNLKHSNRRDDGLSELKNVEKRILEEMEICKTWVEKNHLLLEMKIYIDLGFRYDMHRQDCYETWRKLDRIRDFKLVIAQILVIKGDYNEALKIYQELSEEEPEDLKPYLYQGIMYTLLGKKDDAENNFVKVENEISGRLKKSDYICMAASFLLLAFMLGISIKSYLEFKNKNHNKKNVY